MEKFGDGRIIYYDDCGIYGGRSSHKWKFLKSNLKSLTEKDGELYTNHNCEPKFKLINWKEEDILKVSTLTNKLKSNPQFVRRIVKIEGNDHHLVEYTGMILLIINNIFNDFQIK